MATAFHASDLGSAAADSALAELVDEFGNRLQAGLAVDVEKYAADHPEYADRLRRLLPAVQTLAKLGSSRGGAAVEVNAGAAEEATGLEAGRIGDYRILREVGRGGMGIVYEAEQLSLHRRVALKILPFAATLDRRNLQRFNNEARAAAHLHHTNIVPVFGVGCERNLHYYAMQFIDGETLADLIAHRRRPEHHSPQAPRRARAHGLPTAAHQSGGVNAAAALTKSYQQELHPSPDAPTGPFVPTPPVAGHSTRVSGTRSHCRLGARLGIQAAEALEHAHQSGVVHRDIKPGNLMVDRDGNVWITDFGLAHMQGEPGLTMSGDLVGTLRYMSPEQALAKRGVLDHRTDIYSLGVTLYEFLTLADAYGGRDRVELLHRIVETEPIAPRRLNKAIPTDLETIILKAMAKNPIERYATAQDLGDDLRRFLNDEPILAKRPSLPQRASKWARRHRALVCGVLSAMILAIAGMMVACTLLWLATREMEDQRNSARVSADIARQQLALAQQREQEVRREWQRAETETRRAVKNHRIALDLIEYLSLNLAGSKFAREPLLQPTQRAFMGKAIDFAKELAESVGIPPDQRYEVAIAQFRMGEIQERLGDVAQAEKAYLEAIALIRQVITDKLAHPTGFFDPNYRLMVAACYMNLLNLGCETKRLAVTEEQVASALADFEVQVQRWIRGCPLLPYQRNNQASIYADYADLQFSLGRTDQAEVYLRKALSVCDGLVQEHIEEIEPWACMTLIQIRRKLGGLLQFTGRAAEAEQHLRQSVAEGRKLGQVLAKARAKSPAEKLPDAAEAHAELAWSCLELGNFLHNGKFYSDAESMLREGLRVSADLIAAHPTRPRYRDLAARLNVRLSRICADRTELPDAEHLCRAAVSTSGRNAVDFPSIPDYQDGLADALDQLGLCLVAKGESDEAARCFEQAVRNQQRALELLPRQPAFRARLLLQSRHIVQTLARKGDLGAAHARMNDMVKWLEQHEWSDTEAAQFRSQAESALNLQSELRKAGLPLYVF